MDAAHVYVLTQRTTRTGTRSELGIYSTDQLCLIIRIRMSFGIVRRNDAVSAIAKVGGDFATPKLDNKF